MAAPQELDRGPASEAPSAAAASRRAGGTMRMPAARPRTASGRTSGWSSQLRHAGTPAAENRRLVGVPTLVLGSIDRDAMLAAAGCPGHSPWNAGRRSGCACRCWAIHAPVWGFSQTGCRTSFGARCRAETSHSLKNKKKHSDEFKPLCITKYSSLPRSHPQELVEADNGFKDSRWWDGLALPSFEFSPWIQTI